ncbi:MAG: nicotinate-nucleotide diphosphorylase (carboxylating), partial [Huintestinicola sp.]
KIADGRAVLEASGNINIDTVAAVAKTGVDIISSGAITHSVKAFDISLKIRK